MDTNAATLELYNYGISWENDLNDKKYGLTPKIKELLEETFLKCKDETIGVNEIYELIQKYPHIPQFKNHLSVLYSAKGNSAKALQINDWILDEHPDYLFGKINKAHHYLQNKEYEKVLEILGKALEIKALYPEREVFHATEVIAFNNIAVWYLADTGNIKAAELRLEIIREIDSEADEIKYGEQRIFSAQLKAGAERFKKERETVRNVIPISSFVIEPTEDKPKFIHPQIEQFYCNSLQIDCEIIKEILELPRQSLITDLNTVIYDSIARYDYFSEELEWSKESHEFLNHALFLLIELKATESLGVVLQLLRQDDEFLEYWFGDSLTEDFWEILVVLGGNQLDVLKDYVKEPDNYTFARSQVSVALSQLVLHFPEQRKEVIDWYKDMFQFFIDNKDDDRILDNEVIAFMVGDAVDIEAKELESKIIEIYENELASEYIEGNIEAVLKELHHPSSVRFHKRNLISDIFLRYDDAVNTWQYYKVGYNKDTNENESEGAFSIPGTLAKALSEYNIPDYYADQKPLIAAIKPGRNEPCPCNSGKKYKKCCGVNS